MRPHLRAGVAIYNTGRSHAAHDAWEDRWLALDAGDDERFLHGLIQFTAVVHHGRGENWSGARGLAESAADYLADLPVEYRGVDLATVRGFLHRVAADPEVIDWADPPGLTHEGETLGYDDLDFAATAVAATVLAEADGYDESLVEDAIEYARDELDDREDGRFVGLLFSFVRERDQRPVVFQRLGDHVRRERGKDDDVAGLFD